MRAGAGHRWVRPRRLVLNTTWKSPVTGANRMTQVRIHDLRHAHVSCVVKQCSATGSIRITVNLLPHLLTLTGPRPSPDADRPS